MKGISINLLPTETTVLQQKSLKARKIKLLSVVSLLVLFFLASLTVTLRILQTQTISRLQVSAKASEEEISSLRDKESTLVLLKDRLDQIEKIKALPSKQKDIYMLVVGKLFSANVSSVSIDNLGNLTLSTVASDTTALTNLLTILSNDENFEKIAEVSVDSLSRGRDSVYRMSLKITAR